METAQATDMLKVAEVATMTGLSRASVLREIDKGEFEAFRVGPAKSHIRVTRASVLDYKARRAITAITQPAPVPVSAPAAA